MAKDIYGLFEDVFAPEQMEISRDPKNPAAPLAPRVYHLTPAGGTNFIGKKDFADLAELKKFLTGQFGLGSAGGEDEGNKIALGKIMTHANKLEAAGGKHDIVVKQVQSTTGGKPLLQVRLGPGYTEETGDVVDDAATSAPVAKVPAPVAQESFENYFGEVESLNEIDLKGLGTGMMQKLGDKIKGGLARLAVGAISKAANAMATLGMPQFQDQATKTRFALAQKNMVNLASTTLSTLFSKMAVEMQKANVGPTLTSKRRNNKVVTVTQTGYVLNLVADMVSAMSDANATADLNDVKAIQAQMATNAKVQQTVNTSAAQTPQTPGVAAPGATPNPSATPAPGVSPTASQPKP